jgi:methionine-gamma-lyase
VAEGGSPRDGGEALPPEDPIHTRAVRAGSDPERDLGGLAPALHRSSTYGFATADRAAAVHEGEEPGHFYGRMGTPTQQALEEAVADLEGAEAGLAFASGMAAISSLLFTLIEPGDHVVAPAALYATTGSLLDGLLERHGVSVTYVDGTDPDAFAGALREETRVLWVESPANPTLDLVDLEAVARLGGERGVTTVADNTFATPVVQRPLEAGIDVVAHSATKYLGGHGDVVAGALAGPRDLLERVRWETLKHLGGVVSPDAAWLVLRGLRTLPVRMERHARNALRVARFLEDHPGVERVHYPGLASHSQHGLARRQMSGFGGMVAFEVDGLEVARQLVDRLELCTLAVSLGDVATLVQHSASMTHASVPPERRRSAGIRDGLLRMSVGLERPQDLIDDLGRALDGARGRRDG